jgi:hypothetical protein
MAPIPREPPVTTATFPATPNSDSIIAPGVVAASVVLLVTSGSSLPRCLLQTPLAEL